jgi:uncharacterized protein YybS (DUF2232 family)
MTTYSRTALFDSGKAVASSVALGVVIALVPLLSIIAVPALPIPVAFITSRYGVVAGLFVSLVTGAACMALTVPLVGIYAGLLVFMLAAIAGVGAGLALRRGVSQFRLFVAMAAGFLATLILWLGATLLIIGEGPVTAMRGLADANAETSSQLYRAIGMNQQDVDAAVVQAHDFISTLPYLAPAVLLITSIVLSGANLALARRVFGRLSQPFPRDFVFRDFRAHWVFAYVFILGLLCQLLAPYAPEAYADAVDRVGANLYIVSEVLFFIQGMAIASFFLWAYKVSRVKGLAVYSGLVLLEVTLALTMWLGLFDTWLDYRRRFIKKNLS